MGKQCTKRTVGSVALELQQKEPESSDPIEIQRATEKEYIKNIGICISDNMHRYAGDFYIIVLTKNEKLLYNTFRNYFIARSSCPTPDYDQTVFMFQRESQDILYLWTIPDRETCLLYSNNTHKIVPEEYPLLEQILRFKNGDLFALCKKLNKEEDATPLLAT